MPKAKRCGRRCTFWIGLLIGMILGAAIFLLIDLSLWTPFALR